MLPLSITIAAKMLEDLSIEDEADWDGVLQVSGSGNDAAAADEDAAAHDPANWLAETWTRRSSRKSLRKTEVHTL